MPLNLTFTQVVEFTTTEAANVYGLLVSHDDTVVIHLGNRSATFTLNENIRAFDKLWSLLFDAQFRRDEATRQMRQLRQELVELDIPTWSVSNRDADLGRRMAKIEELRAEFRAVVEKMRVVLEIVAK